MTKLRDKVKIVPLSELPMELKKAAAHFEKRANEIFLLSHLQEASRVFPNVLKAMARQINILSACASLPIEVVAGACRTVYEINIRIRLMTQNSELIKEFWIERVFDELSLLEAFKRLANVETSSAVLRPIDLRIWELSQYIQKWQLKKPASESVAKLAEKVGCLEEYKSLYGFYSKYTHGSAWLVNAKDSERDGEGFRNILIINAQLYAYDSLKRIDDYMEKHNKEYPIS